MIYWSSRRAMTMNSHCFFFVAFPCTYLLLFFSGMGPDFRVLVRKSRKQAQQYYRLYKVFVTVDLVYIIFAFKWWCRFSLWMCYQITFCFCNSFVKHYYHIRLLFWSETNNLCCLIVKISIHCRKLYLLHSLSEKQLLLCRSSHSLGTISWYMCSLSLLCWNC